MMGLPILREILFLPSLFETILHTEAGHLSSLRFLPLALTVFPSAAGFFANKCSPKKRGVQNLGEFLVLMLFDFPRRYF